MKRIASVYDWSRRRSTWGLTASVRRTEVAPPLRAIPFAFPPLRSSITVMPESHHALDQSPDMNIKEIRFTGLIQNRGLTTITGPEFLSALAACGWKEGTGTHFLKELRADAQNRAIFTPADLVRAIQRGVSEPSGDGKWIHRICNRTAYIIYNPTTRTLITFSPGNPPPRR